MEKSPPQTFGEAFKGKRYVLTEMMDLDHGLLIHMLDNELITIQQLNVIRSRDSDMNRCFELLVMLESGDSSKLVKFLELLVATNQKHVADFILGYPFKEVITTGQQQPGSSQQQDVTMEVEPNGLSRSDIEHNDDETKIKRTRDVTMEHNGLERSHIDDIDDEMQIKRTRDGTDLQIKGCALKAREYLKEIIEPDYGLLDHLISLEVLTDRECSDVRGETSVYKRLDRLLDLMLDKSQEQCRDFLLALERTDQQHVVNYIQQEGNNGAEYGDVRPLDQARIRHIALNTPQLVELINSDIGFLADLEAAGSITHQQRSNINDLQITSDKNRKLLDILKRRSVAHLREFVNALANNKQSHLVPLFKKSGVIVNVDATLDGCSADEISQCEDRVVSEFKAMLPDCTEEGKGRIMSKVEELQELTRSLGMEIHLVVIEKQNSIGSYFFCETSNSLGHLYSLYVSRKLRQMLESLFSLLSKSSSGVRVKSLVWLKEHYEQSLKYFDVKQEDDIADCGSVTGLNVMDSLPVELLELLLMTSYMKLFAGGLKSGVHISDAELTAYKTLASVCGDWWQTLIGWPQSNTKDWMRHKLQRLVKYVCRPYRRRPPLVSQLSTKSNVKGVTQMNDNVYVVSSLPESIQVFGVNYEQLEDIKVQGLKEPLDIVACSETESLYIVDWGSPVCVRRASTDGKVDKFLPTATSSSFYPWSLSVTSGRLLVAADSNVILLFGADGVELKRLSFADISEIRHAVETSRGTFIFCHTSPKPQVVEVDGDGRIISVYNDQQQLAWPHYLSIDPEGKIFVADYTKQRILLLTSDLQLDRVLLDTEHNQLVERPYHLLYVQQTRQLLVGSELSPVVQVFAVGC